MCLIFDSTFSFDTHMYQPYISQSSSAWKPFTGTPSPFTAGSEFTLASPEAPQRAIALITEEEKSAAILGKFGDFDDHLEDVSIDWLRNKACMAVAA